MVLLYNLALVKCQNVLTTYCNLGGVIFCIIIGDEHQFIGYCLIPLDPWAQLLGLTMLLFQMPPDLSRKTCF